MAAKRGPTAYFVFADQHRKQVKDELQALGEGAKVSVGAVGKALGAKWSALSDEEKLVYKDLAKQRAQGGRLCGVPAWSSSAPCMQLHAPTTDREALGECRAPCPIHAHTNSPCSSHCRSSGGSAQGG